MEAHNHDIAALLYRGILHRDDWHEGLDALSRAVGGILFHHMSYEHATAQVETLAVNADVAASRVDVYERHYAPIDPRVALGMRASVGELILDQEHFSRRDISRSELYTDWLIPNGFCYSAAIVAHDDGATREFIGINRPHDQIGFDDDDRQLLRRVMPDLMRAAGLRTHMARETGSLALGLAALDALPQALMVVDEKCRLRYCNRAAERALSQQGSQWLLVHAGRLGAAAPALQSQLRAAVAEACAAAPRAGMAGHGNLRMHVLPLTVSHPLGQVLRDQPHALISWSAPLGASPAVLMDALGLTPTEARLALALADGLSVKEFCAQQGCSYHTARTHVRNILTKTGCSRQSEVIRMIYALMAG